MSTTSTKSRRKKSQDAPRKKDGVTGATNTPSAPVAGAEISQRTWRLASMAILFVGAFLRLYKLGLVPLHHDEGVNGNFLVTLVREGASKYQYNPENYHGPTLYFFSAVIPWVFRFFGGLSARDAYGLTTFNVRLVTAAFGIATIGLALLLRKRLGTIGALSAAAIIAISPGAVYLSRYFIHESLFVFFTLGVVVAGLKYFDTGRGIYFILAAASAALMVATKETWIINSPVLLIAFGTTLVYVWLRERIGGEQIESAGERIGKTLDHLGGPVPIATVFLVALTVFIVVNVLFYSSFLTNYPKGVRDAMQTLNLWRRRTNEHAHPFLQYFEWLRQMESPLLLLGAVGAAIAVWRGNNRFALFTAQWGFGLLVAYSLVKYKTPWISLNFIVPLAIVSGYALEQLYRRFGQPWVPLALIVGAIALLIYGRLVTLKPDFESLGSGLTWDFDFSKYWPVIVAIVLLAVYAGYVLYSRFDRGKYSPHFYLAAAIMLVVFSYQMYQLNFVHYDDDGYAYVYAHTRRETLALVDEVDRISKRLKTGNDTGIALVSPDYWPLPWYFRDYKRVGYYQRIVPTTEPIIIGSMAQEEELQSSYGDRYQQIDSHQLSDPRVDPAHSPNGSFELRPGVDLLLYVRKDVAK